MQSVNFNRAHWILVGLAALMVATRFHHEGGPFTLPDASLAVFFLLGWYSRRLPVFAGFLLLAFVVDYLAIACLGVSGYCVSPAYAFLVPTYGVMWGAGRWAGRTASLDGRAFGRFLAALTSATTVAFLISNWSFFFWSSRVNGVSWADYAIGIGDYYPAYLAAALLYSSLVFGLQLLSHFRLSAERWQMRFK